MPYKRMNYVCFLFTTARSIIQHNEIKHIGNEVAAVRAKASEHQAQ